MTERFCRRIRNAGPINLSGANGIPSLREKIMIVLRQRKWVPASVGVVLMLAGLALGRQTERWYPSRGGANDQRGAANRITPAKVLEAKNLITRGTVYPVGRTYETGMPMFGTRHY